MTRVFLVLPALALLGASPAAQPNNRLSQPTRVISPEPSVCKEIGSVARGDPTRPEMKNLAELPPAMTYMAVYRTDERGCIDPMLASERQGLRAPR
jgi:hypothetical protein